MELIDIRLLNTIIRKKESLSKGKVESSNRFVEWLKPYDGELESEDELLEVIKKFNRQINEETNQTTGIPVFRMSMCKKCRKHCLSHTKAMDALSAKN